MHNRPNFHHYFYFIVISIQNGKTHSSLKRTAFTPKLGVSHLGNNLVTSITLIKIWKKVCCWDSYYFYIKVTWHFLDVNNFALQHLKHYKSKIWIIFKNKNQSSNNYNSYRYFRSIDNILWPKKKSAVIRNHERRADCYLHLNQCVMNYLLPPNTHCQRDGLKSLAECQERGDDNSFKRTLLSPNDALFIASRSIYYWLLDVFNFIECILIFVFIILKSR